MAYTIEPWKIIRPLTHVLVDVPVPTYGTRLTLIAGFPASGGRDVGEMEDAPKLKRLGKMNEEKSVTSATPVDYYITEPGATLEVALKRHVLDNIKLALRGASLSMPDGSVSVGLSADTEVESHSIVVVYETRAGSGIYGYIMLYDAICGDDVEIGLTPDKAVVVKQTFKGRPVSGRPIKFAIGEYNIPQDLV